MPVGVGGMGQVWAALRLQSPESGIVALKTILDAHANNEDFERIFVDEARIASRIAHPNVCAVHEFGTDRGCSYLAMQWVDGGTLHDILTAAPTRRIDCHVAASIAASVCAGLHAAHELMDEEGNPLHVIHRDVSPQNILVSRDGEVCIADFGIARAKGQSHTPTRTGELKGKLSYMAPEQLTASEFDRRVDVFALGCVLFQATTGQRPFQGGDTLETMYRLLESECPRPSTLVADYPMRLESIVLTALAKDSSSRYQTAAEFGDDLLRFLAARGKLSIRSEIVELVNETLGTPLAARATQIAQASLRFQKDARARRRLERKVASRRAMHRWMAFAAVPIVLVAGTTVRSQRSNLAVERGPNLAHGVGGGEATASKIAVEVVTDPPNGWIRFEDGLVVKSPWRVLAEPNNPPQTIVAGLDGFAEEQQRIEFTASAHIRIPLRPLPRASKGFGVPTSSRMSSSHPDATTTSAVGTSTRDSLPPRQRKSRRHLDPENPY